ncbi:MAG: putative porin [Marinifilaceae bacterium]
MKKLLYIIILCLTHTLVWGQRDLGRTNEFMDHRLMEGEEGEKQDQTHNKDSVKQEHVDHFRHNWQWKNDGVYKQIIPLDTLPDGIHNYNYIFKKSISNTYLANFPSPYVSDIFMLRGDDESFYQLSSVRAYLFKPVDMLNFNTTTPFTQLWYSSGGGKGKNETMLNVWHTQNITPFWNAGFRYNLISSDGRYMNQKSKAYNLSFFTSYERERVAINFFINQNNGHFNENGGVADKAFVRDSTDEKAENIPVKLGQGVKNVYRNFNANLMAQYNIGREKEKVVNNDTTYTYPFRAVLNMTVEDNMWRFRENTVYPDFFNNTYIDESQNVDVTDNMIMRVAGKLILNEHPRFRGIPGVYAGATYEYDKYHQKVSYDFNTKLTEMGNFTHNNLFLTAGIFNLDTTVRLNYNVHGALSVAGSYIGNFQIGGFVQHAFNRAKTSYIHAEADVSLRTPDPFFSRYISNHFIWENDFKDTKRIDISGKYVNTKTRTELGIGLNNVFGYVYLDTLALPKQENSGIMVTSAWVKQNFRAGRFHFDQTLYWQSSSNKDVLDLPMVAVYSHNYYQNAFFKDVLKFQIGFDMFYNTAFYADNYQPALMQFYNQRQEKTGNYPKFDVFATFGIKRATFFVKYEHLNYLFTNGEYFSALDYPINPAMVKFGLRWNFYD